MRSAEAKPVVTLAALYGAGGSVIGPRVAERLGVSFLDREIPEAVSANGPFAGCRRHRRRGATQPQRAVDSRLGRASTVSGAAGGAGEHLGLQERRLRAHVEEFLARASESGGVALGRGGMVVLRDVPSALHVYLDPAD